MRGCSVRGWRARALGACTVVMALAGCTGAATPAAFCQTQRAGAYEGTLAIKPYPPLTMEKTELRLALRDGAGHPLGGATVSYDLTMPYCTVMPANRPQAMEEGAGIYVSRALFTMAGYWKATAAIHTAEGDGALVFYFEVR